MRKFSRPVIPDLDVPPGIPQLLPATLTEALQWRHTAPASRIPHSTRIPWAYKAGANWV